MKTQNLTYLSIIITFISVFNCSCKKEPSKIPSPTTPVSYTVTDTDGNVYNTVTIGTQVWLKEDLKTTRYRNGDPIPNVTDATQWSNLTTGAWRYYDDYSPDNIILYNWYAVSDPRNICPVGWHVPSDAEWTTLINYLGGASVAGGAMKATGDNWHDPNTGATNSSDFTALPTGYLGSDGYFNITGSYFSGSWWSSTMDSVTTAYGLGILNEYSSAGTGPADKRDGEAIRCLKD